MNTLHDEFKDAIVSAIPPDYKIIEWIRKNYSPEEIFAPDELAAWAIQNNFTRDEAEI